MPPPQLAADAPILDALQPVLVGLSPVGGTEHDVAVGHGLRGLLHAGVLEEPLHAEARLDGNIRALGDTHVVIVVLHLLQKPLVADELDGLLASHKAVEAV